MHLVDIAAEHLIHDLHAHNRQLTENNRLISINYIAQEVIEMTYKNKQTFQDRKLCIEIHHLDLNDYTSLLTSLKSILSDKEYEKYFKYLQNIRSSLVFTAQELEYFSIMNSVTANLQGLAIHHDQLTEDTITTYEYHNDRKISIYTEFLLNTYLKWDSKFQLEHGKYPDKNLIENKVDRLLELHSDYQKKLSAEGTQMLIWFGIGLCFVAFIVFAVIVNAN